MHGMPCNVPVPHTQAPQWRCLQVWADIYGLPVPGCEGKTAVQIFEAAGCITPAPPSCAACLGGPKDTFARMNEVCQAHSTCTCWPVYAPA